MENNNKGLPNGYTQLTEYNGYVYVWGKNPYGEAGTGNTYRIAYATKLNALEQLKQAGNKDLHCAWFAIC